MSTATSTLVKVQCVSKKEGFQYQNPQGGVKETDIELQVPYDPTSVFYKQSGGTNFVLKTINQEAADMFTIGNYYDVNITPATK